MQLKGIFDDGELAAENVQRIHADHVAERKSQLAVLREKMPADLREFCTLMRDAFDARLMAVKLPDGTIFDNRNK